MLILSSLSWPVVLRWTTHVEHPDSKRTDHVGGLSGADRVAGRPLGPQPICCLRGGRPSPARTRRPKYAINLCWVINTNAHEALRRCRLDYRTRGYVGKTRAVWHGQVRQDARQVGSGCSVYMYFAHNFHVKINISPRHTQPSGRLVYASVPQPLPGLSAPVEDTTSWPENNG